MRRTISITILALVLGTTLVACGGSDKKTVETADGKVTVTKDDQSVTVEGEDGSVTIGGASVPDDFPSDVPLPKDGELLSAISASDSFQLAYQMDEADLEAAVSDYKSALEGDGFAVDDGAAFSGGGAAFSGFQAKGNGWTVVVVGGAAAASGSTLSVSVTPSD